MPRSAEKLMCAAATDVGRIRDSNEDHFLLDSQLGLFVVCDGLGGHRAGEVASALACEVACEHVRQEAGDVEEMARAAVRAASGAVHERACSDKKTRGMATTMTLVLVRGDTAAWGHVGDSRLYALRAGKFSLLTNDHTLAEEQVRAGLLTREESSHSPAMHVLSRALGPAPDVDVETGSIALQSGDSLLLCTDGIFRELTEKEIGQQLRVQDVNQVVSGLIERARRHGGNDNLTALCIRQTAAGHETLIRRVIRFLTGHERNRELRRN